jgi:phosphoribosylformimino-5-aminoimidazole carboxamide ribonucleotide (ProFAR) isomerase
LEKEGVEGVIVGRALYVKTFSFAEARKLVQNH